MKISCSIAEDLLPLYVDESCSQDSKIALEDHLAECSSCREKYKRMKVHDLSNGRSTISDTRTVSMVSYARKVRCYRRFLRVLILVTIIILAFLMSVLGRAFSIMQYQRTTPVTDIEEGTCNLTLSDFVCTVEEAEELSIFTNSTQIVVTVTAGTDFSGSIILRKTNQKNERIMLGKISNKYPTCVFTNLIPESRYGISFEGVPSGSVRLSGDVSFWRAVWMVLTDII